MVIEGAIDKFGSFVKERFPRFVTVKQPSPQFRDQFLTQLEAGGLPIGIGFHFSHVEGLIATEACVPLLEMARQAGLEDRLPRFMIPVAASMRAGHQGIFLKHIYPHMSAYSEDRGLDYVEVVREKDESKFGMKWTRKLLVNYINHLKSPRGIVLLPEASVDAGRHVGWWFNDNIKGVRKLHNDSILRICIDSEKFSNRKPFFFFIIYQGAYHLYSPDSKLPTPEGLVGLSDRVYHQAERYGYQLPVVEASLEGPILTGEELGLGNYRQIKALKGDDYTAMSDVLNDTIMRKGVVHLREDYRGVYREQPVVSDLVLDEVTI